MALHGLTSPFLIQSWLIQLSSLLSVQTSPAFFWFLEYAFLPSAVGPLHLCFLCMQCCPLPFPLPLVNTCSAFKYQLKSWEYIFWTPWWSQCLLCALTKVCFAFSLDHLCNAFIRAIIWLLFYSPLDCKLSRAEAMSGFAQCCSSACLEHVRLLSKYILNENKGSTQIIAPLCFSTWHTLISIIWSLLVWTQKKLLTFVRETNLWEIEVPGMWEHRGG